CSYHVCHVSTKESVEIIRQAKKRGVDVTCETAPHYLTLCEDDLQEDGRYKMNPPLRSAEDKAALIEGLIDGTIDCIATDHAPHSYEEKAKGLQGSLMGIVGLETAFPVLYTKLIRTGVVPLKTVVDALTVNPAKRFGLASGISVGDVADMTIFDLTKKYEIDSLEFQTKGRSSPFSGWTVYGKNVCTICDGRMI
ncbi:MAG: amidohydrolase family protein, partial [Clostridia bacterium]|nr:amidohydrolase family protein [Clostridia bacterium]